jgi:hypothetical protein
MVGRPLLHAVVVACHPRFVLLRHHVARHGVVCRCRGVGVAS